MKKIPSLFCLLSFEVKNWKQEEAKRCEKKRKNWTCRGIITATSQAKPRTPPPHHAWGLARICYMYSLFPTVNPPTAIYVKYFTGSLSATLVTRLNTQPTTISQPWPLRISSNRPPPPPPSACPTSMLQVWVAHCGLVVTEPTFYLQGVVWSIPNYKLNQKSLTI